ncbi:GNAT family N-acetyltransferase [Haloarcula sp. JP-L23]|uniref:GNAT family N-acetyltransferase n=1 Tax=Haloarcula sp. JP-L23 TaxID=2716717 RepID=UPI00140ED093|nr:GNAT family N-acetyltransferase [Haloarcula sp. JP-L23]
MSDSDDAPVTVRRYQAGDGDRVRELNEIAMAETPEYVPEAPDDDLRAVRDHYLDGEGEFLVGTLDGTVVATGAYTTPSEWKRDHVALDDETAELTRMRVDPDRQGRGVGSAVYRALERRALAEGYRRFVLDTGTENDTARGFYEYLGFTCVREVPVDFGPVTLDLALYETAIDR